MPGSTVSRSRERPVECAAAYAEMRRDSFPAFAAANELLGEGDIIRRKLEAVI